MRFISLKLTLALLTICLFQINSISQEKATISGYITDGKSGEEMIGIKIYIPSIKKGAITNAYGFYSITIPKGAYNLEYRSSIYPTEKIIITYKRYNNKHEMGIASKTLRKLLSMLKKEKM